MERYSEYKDSGVQWLGEIPGHWNCVRIKALFLNIREKNNPIQTEERLSLSIDKGVTLYSEKTTNLDRFKEDCSQYLLAHEDDIVLNSMNMIVGAVGKSKYFGCVSPAYYVIRLRDTSNYIDYYSQLLNIQKIRDVYRIMGKGIMAIDRGDGKVNTCRLKVPYDSFGSIKIPLPPLSEQHSIVSYLDDKCGKIDKMLEGKQKQIELLAEMKQRIIADAVTHGLNPDVKMKETNIPWLPEIPEHWSCVKLKAFWKENKENRLPLLFEQAGRWWGTDPRTRKQEEIDILAGNADKDLLLCECKWRNEDTDIDTLQTLLRRGTLFEAHSRSYILFTKRNFSERTKRKAEEIENLRLVSYKEMI